MLAFEALGTPALFSRFLKRCPQSLAVATQESKHGRMGPVAAAHTAAMGATDARDWEHDAVLEAIAEAYTRFLQEAHDLESAVELRAFGALTPLQEYTLETGMGSPLPAEKIVLSRLHA